MTRLEEERRISNLGLSREERRDIISLCCAVARADGHVSPTEYERLLDLFSRAAQGAVGFDELQEWLELGPPTCQAKLTEDKLRLFLHEAIGIARADGKVDRVEIDTIKQIVQACFDGGDKYL